jgi:hypothetical protein
VKFFESGIAGISLVQELMDGYDALVIIDAHGACAAGAAGARLDRRLSGCLRPSQVRCRLQCSGCGRLSPA